MTSRVGRVVLRAFVAVLLVYGFVAYVVVPVVWRRDVRRHPALDDVPGITRTMNGVPGDPLNVALIGSDSDIHLAMHAANWYPADPITLHSAMRIATDVVFDRPYDDAPVSALYLWGRRQDLAFEQSIGTDPRRRHHVRFWRSDKLDASGKPCWLGSATMDIRVGFSHETGQITHHIAPDVDAERDNLMNDIRKAGDLQSETWIDGFHKVMEGKNGGGDRWYTDGRLAVGTIALRSRS